MKCHKPQLKYLLTNRGTKTTVWCCNMHLGTTQSVNQSAENNPKRKHTFSHFLCSTLEEGKLLTQRGMLLFLF